MDITKTRPISLAGSIIIFVLYWIMIPIMNVIKGPEWTFTPTWWFAMVALFSLFSIWSIMDEIHKIAEPGEVRWFSDNELLKIPPKAGKP